MNLRIGHKSNRTAGLIVIVLLLLGFIGYQYLAMGSLMTKNTQLSDSNTKLLDQLGALQKQLDVLQSQFEIQESNLIHLQCQSNQSIVNPGIQLYSATAYVISQQEVGTATKVLWQVVLSGQNTGCDAIEFSGLQVNGINYSFSNSYHLAVSVNGTNSDITANPFSLTIPSGSPIQMTFLLPSAPNFVYSGAPVGTLLLDSSQTIRLNLITSVENYSSISLVLP